MQSLDHTSSRSGQDNQAHLESPNIAINRLSKKLRPSRLDFLFEKYSPILSSVREYTTWEEIQALDPTPRKRHLEWILKQVCHGKLVKEDFYKVPLMINELRRAAPLMRKDSISVDLNQYDCLPAIHRALAPYAEQLTQAELNAQEREEIDAQTEYLVDTPDLLVVYPITEKASCFWGRGTRWCTASTDSNNAFELYNNDFNRLFIFIDKADGGKKYQLTRDGSSFLDAQDDDFIPELKLDFMRRTVDHSIDVCSSILADLDLGHWKLPGELSSQVVSFLNGQSQLLQAEVLKKAGSHLRYIKNQNEGLCLDAIRNDPWSLKHANVQTENLCLEAVGTEGRVLKFVKHQTELICLTAVEQDGRSLEYVINKTPDICKMAIQNSPFAIAFINNPPLDLCLAAIRLDWRAIRFIKTQTPEICFEAVKQSPAALEFVKDKTPELCKLASAPKADLFSDSNTFAEKPEDLVLPEMRCDSTMGNAPSS